MGAPPKDEFLGAVLDGLYRVQSVLGEGGMARVYLAENLKLKGRSAVVKRPMLEEVAAAGRLSQAEGWAQEDLLERFQTEIQQLIDARHGAIVDILSQGVHAGMPYYVLEHMDAGSLEDRIRKGAQTPSEILAWLKPIADALDYIHGQQVVHRDVKPSNILFRREGNRERACLSDFGIVKVLGEGGSIRTMTFNTNIGTYAFMAPEQSDPNVRIDGRADQYALAATVYQALTRHVLFHDVPPLDRPGAKKFRDPIRVDAEGMAPQLPRDAADAVMRGVARDRDDRFPSCTAFAEAFEQGLVARLVEVPRPPPPPAPPPPPRARARTLVLGLFLLGLVAAGFAARSAIWGRTPTPEEPGDPTRILVEQAAERAEAGDWDTAERLIEDAKAKGAKDADIPPSLKKGLELPSLAIEGAVGERSTATVTVTLATNRAAETLAVNGRTWSKPTGTWQIEVAVSGAGKQTLKVAVVRRGKEVVTRTTTVEMPLDAPLEIDWAEPKDGATVGEAKVRVKGEVKTARASDRVLVNGKEARTGPGPFEGEIALEKEGAHRLELTVVDGTTSRRAPEIRFVIYAASWRALVQQASDQALAGDWDEAERLVDEAKSRGAGDGDLPAALRKGLEPPDLTIDGARVEGAVAKLAATLKTGRPTETVAAGGKTWAKPSGDFEIDVPLSGTGRQTVKVAVVRRGKEVVVRTATVEIPAPQPPPPPAPDDKPPAWAKVSKEQLDAARRLGVPVAFENPIGMRFVLIPPGRFTMGSPESEESRDSDESQHEVEITKAYYLAIHETTNAQYKRFDPGHKGTWNDPDLPVETVSHDDATRFVAWLDTQDRGHKYRLPTEAEWEYACRAGTKTPFSFGETISADQANYDGRSTYGRGPKGVYRERTMRVRTFPANVWGLCDMHGNVWEWCADWYEDGYYAKSPRQDPPGSASGSARVLRGGSWYSYLPTYVRSAYRYRNDPGFSSDYIGFRVVAAVAAAPAEAEKPAPPASRSDEKPPAWAKVSKEQLEAARRLGVKAWYENPIGLRFVLIPPGKFTMGSPESEESRDSDEPHHEVEITKAYYLEIHETTNVQYKRFDASHKGRWDEANQPVEKVSHDDAARFVAWLEGQDRGRKYRLPTEAEWEYACRAGTRTPFWCGETISTDHANYDGNDTYGTGVKGTHRRETTRVGSFPANGWGLYDMHGNVWEWCADWYDGGYYAKSPRQDPPGPASSPEGARVLRGGSWCDGPRDLRSARRLRSFHGSPSALGGFRVVMAVSGAPE